MDNGAETITRALEFMKSGALAAFGGLVGHLVDYARNDTKFSTFQFLIAILVAFFVGQVLGEWLPADMTGRDGVLMVAGTSGYPILAAMQERVKKLIERPNSPV